MQKPLPTIYCKACHLTQPYRQQTECLHCGKRLSSWHISSQLEAQRERERLNLVSHKKEP